MSEAWILADKELLKEEIGTDKNNQELGLVKHPETIANPKQAIENALQIAQEYLPKRRNKITIAEIYQPIGQNISLEKLYFLESFKKFANAVKKAFERLEYI